MKTTIFSIGTHLPQLNISRFVTSLFQEITNKRETSPGKGEGMSSVQFILFLIFQKKTQNTHTNTHLQEY